MTTQIFAKSKAINPPAQPEIFVAAFGKHVAWNDFIDDPGLETEKLIAIKRVLYLEGIAAAIETGSWDKLDAAQRTEGFSHLIIWRSRTDIVVCRLWSSSDGKGRTKYPMVVVAQCKGASLAWVLTEALPRLERLEKRCREATTQEQVRAALDATRTELRARAAVAEAAAPIHASAVAEVAGDLTVSGSRDGFYRLMYQIERDWGSFLMRRPDTVSSTRTWSGGTRSQHARVPSGAGNVGDEITLWSHFILSLVDVATSVVLIRNTEPSSPAAAWTDIIVGEPEGGQFFCIRASDQSLPLATSIPYTLDADLKSRCDRLIDDSRAGKVGGKTPEIVTNVQPGLLQRVKGLLGGKKKGVLVLLLAVGLVGTGVAIALFFSGPSGGGSGGKPDRTAAEKPREHPPPVTPNPAPALIPAAEAGDWGRLCAAYHDWFAEFVQRLQKRPGGTAGGGVKTRAEFYATDPYLKGLLDRLHAAQTSGHGIDPWSIAGVPKSQELSELAKNPPAKVAEPAIKARVSEAMAIIDGFSVRLASDWPALKTLDEAAKSLESAGLVAEASFLRSLAAGVDAGQAGGPAQGIDAILAASGVVTELRARMAIRDRCVARTVGSTDPVLKQFNEWAVKTTAPSTGAVDLASLENLSRSLAKVAEVAGPLLKFLDEQWGNTDTKLLSQRVAAADGLQLENPTRESFLAWIELAKLSPKLDPTLDPRLAAAAPQLLQQAQVSRKRLEEEFKASPDERLVDLEGSAKRSLDEVMALPFNAESKHAIVDGLAKVESQLKELKQGLENAVAVESARRAGSAREIRDGLVAQQTIVASSESINIAWRSGRDKLLETTSDQDYAELRVSADALRTALLSLDSEFPQGVSATGADPVAQAIAETSRADRERSIGAVLKDWKGIGADRTGSELKAAGEKAASDYERRRGELVAVERDLSVIRAQVSAGASLSEKTPGGEPLASVVERCRRSGVMKDPAIAAAVGSLLMEVESLERVESLVGAKELVEAAEAALPAKWPTALAAWRRLGRLTSPAWPDSFDALARESNLSGRLLEAIASANSRALIETEIHTQRAVRWARAFATLTDPAEIDAAAAMADDMSVKESELPTRLRYNLRLATVRRATFAGTIPDEQARDKAETFERDVQAMGESVASLPGVSQLLARLGPISGRQASEAPKIDVTRLGPGSIAGFTGNVDGALLKFTRETTGSPLTLEFVRIDSPGVETFFMCTTEVSLGQVIAAVEAAGAWKDFGSLFASADPEEDFRKGPRVWRWVDDKQRGVVLRSPEKWLRELATGRNVPETPRTMAASHPSVTHPMNYISPEAALMASHLLGCRLPTMREWTAAATIVEANKRLQQCNLRDAQWKAEQAYINELARTGSVNWPDDDVFVPTAGARPRTGPDAPSNTWDDGVLWFAPISHALTGDTGQMRHLIGNVAEYAVDVPPADLLPAAGGPSAQGAKAILSRRREALKVIGGSALSPLELAPTQPQTLDLEDAVGGFADVGFRLVFSAAGAGPVVEPLGVQLARALSEATYIIEGSKK